MLTTILYLVGLVLDLEVSAWAYIMPVLFDVSLMSKFLNGVDYVE